MQEGKKGEQERAFPASPRLESVLADRYAIERELASGRMVIADVIVLAVPRVGVVRLQLSPPGMARTA